MSRTITCLSVLASCRSGWRGGLSHGARAPLVAALRGEALGSGGGASSRRAMSFRRASGSLRQATTAEAAARGRAVSDAAHFAPCAGGPRRGGGLPLTAWFWAAPTTSGSAYAARCWWGFSAMGSSCGFCFRRRTRTAPVGSCCERRARPRGKEQPEDAERKDPSLFFAGHWLPFEAATSHFLVMGATNTGKTLVQRMLMQSALKSIGAGRDQRAIVFDAKQDVLSILAGMNLNCPVVTLDPFDARGYAWDMAADITTRKPMPRRWRRTLCQSMSTPRKNSSTRRCGHSMRR